MKWILQLQSIQIQTSCSTQICSQSQEITPLILHRRPQIPATCCRLLSSCWIPACTTPTSGTSPPWSDLSPWTEASMREEICRRSFSGWGLDCDEGVGDGERVTAAATRRRHFPLCLPFICVSPLLQNLYDSIKNEPFKIPEDDGNDLTHTFFNPDREGWLLKLGTCIREWLFKIWEWRGRLTCDI